MHALNKILKVLVLTIVSYLLALLSISGFYHENDNYYVLLKRTLTYLNDSWWGLLVSFGVVGLVFGRKLLGGSGAFKRLQYSFAAVLGVSFLTSLLFFAGQTGIFSSELGLKNFFDLMVYSWEQSLVGILYCIPVIIGCTIVLDLVLSESKKN